MSKFKKGDRVRTSGVFSFDPATGTVESVGRIFVEVSVDGKGNGWNYLDDELRLADELEPVEDATGTDAAEAPLQLEAGKYYRTRDGRKVGPMRHEGGYWFGDVVDGPHSKAFLPDGNHGNEFISNQPEFDLIAEWVDEPKSTKEILDDLEAWMAEQDASRDNNPSPTAGFTVPLCAYEDTVTTTALGDAYVAGYKAGLAAQQAATAALAA